jgi:Holliday junction resolvase RusA-like endonuclease
MLQMLKFEIPGEACAQGRPRFTTISGQARAYDPAKSKNYKAYVKLLAQEAIARQGWKYTELPISIKITCSLAIPTSKSKKFKGAALIGKVFPTKKPDVDNLFKTITDALSGIAYKDDKQIITAIVSKFYGEEPHVRVQITVLGSDALL